MLLAALAVPDAVAWPKGVVRNGAVVAGPSLVIPASSGQMRGTTPIQSFHQFDLAAGQNAMFTAPASVTSIVARVGGPSPSTIDGTISTRLENNVGAAFPGNFCLINPCGITIGHDAFFDVGGSLILTTANGVRLPDGTLIGSSDGVEPLLKSAPPASFDFLGPTVSPISILSVGNFEGIVVPDGKCISAVGGAINLGPGSGTIRAPSGRVNLVAVGGSGTVLLDAGAATADVPVVQTASRADVVLGSGTLIDITADQPGVGAGQLVVRARNLDLDSAQIQAVTQGGNGGTIDLGLSGNLALDNGATVVSQTTSTGRAGDIAINAVNIELSGGQHNHQRRQLVSLRSFICRERNLRTKPRLLALRATSR